MQIRHLGNELIEEESINKDFVVSLSPETKAIEQINLSALFETLVKRNIAGDSQVRPKSICDFMSTKLDQTYRRGNSLHWLQLFLNASQLEKQLVQLNPQTLSYIEQNHETLGTQARGNFIPDFYFTVDGIRYTLEIKIYGSVSKFNSYTYKDFEGADYVLAYIIPEHTFYLRKQVNKSKTYLYAIALSELSEPVLSLFAKLNLPTEITMINFNCAQCKTDNELLSNCPVVFYYFNTYPVI